MPGIERRKFQRVNTNLGALLNQTTRLGIISLALDHCIVETVAGSRIEAPLELAFTINTVHLELRAHTVHALSPTHFALRFAIESHQQAEALNNAIAFLERHRPHTPAARTAIQATVLVNQEPTRVTNISTGGCFLQTATAYAIGAIVEARFILEDVPFQCLGQVRWKTPDGVGIEFLSVSPLQKQRLTDFIETQTVAVPPPR